MKKSYRIWLAGLVVGTFFVFFGQLALDRTLNSALLRTLLQDKIGTMLDLTFDYRAVRISFIPLGVEFQDIEVRGTEAQEFRAVRATADLSWWSLFMGTPKVGNFRIDKPVVRLTSRLADETTASEGEQNTAWHWPQLVTGKLERLSLSDPDLRFELTSAAGQRHLFTLQGGELRLDFQPADKVLATLHLDTVNYHHDDKQRLQDLAVAAQGEFGKQGFAFQIERLNAHNIEQLRGEVRGQTTVDAQQMMTSPLQVQASFDWRGDLAILDALLDLEGSHGHSEAEFSFEMRFAPATPPDFKATGRAKVKQAVLGGIKLHDSEARLTITPRQLLFEDGKFVVAGEPRGAFHGTLAFKPLVFDFGGKIERVTFAELMSTFNTKLDIFNFDLATQKLRVRGQGKPFSLQVQADTQLSAWQIHRLRNHRPSPVCALQLDLHTNRKRLRFKRLQGNCTQAEHDSGKLALHGTIAYGTGQLDLHLDAPALSLAAVDFLLPEKLQGQGTLKTALSGAGERVLVRTKLDLKQVRLQAEKIGNIVGELDFHRNFVDWRKVRLRPAYGGEFLSPRGKLTYADLRFDTQLAVRAVSAIDLQHLLRRVKSPLLFGIDKLSAHLSGFLPYPLAYRGTVQAQLRALQATEGEKLADKLNFSAKADRRGWQLTLQRLQRAALVLQGSVTQRRQVALHREKFSASPHLWERLGLHRRDKLQVQLSARQEDEAAQQLPYLGEHFKARFTAFSLNLAGAVQSLRGEVRAELDASELAGIQFGTLRVAGEIDAGKLVAQLSDVTRRLRGQMQVDFAPRQLPFSWQLVFDAFDLRQLFGHSSDTNNYARVSGRWNMQGELLRWFKASGELALDALQVRHRLNATRERAFLLQLQAPQRISLTHGKLTVVGGKKITFTSGDTLLAVALRPDCTLRRPTLDLEGAIDTAILPHFLAEVDVATGFLQLEGKLRWRRAEPQLSLKVERLSPLAVSVAGLRPAFNDIDIRANYRRGTLVIEKLQGRKGEGLIVVQGEIHWHDKAQSFLQLDLRNAHFIHPVLGFKNTELHLDGNLTLRWRELPLALEGELTVSRASNFSEFDIRKVILARFGEKKYRPAALARKAAVNFDLNIVADRSLTIENRNMQAQLSARLQLRGDNVAPRLGGFVKIERGRFVYRRSFTLTQGMVSFDGGRRINPRLDIRATSEVSPYVVDLLISGTAAEPVGELTVTPSARDDGTPISKADILMLLSRGSLPDPDTALTDTGSAGFSEVTNVLVGQFEQPLQDLLKRSGQDVISRIFIDTYASPEGVLYPKLTAPINLPWQDWGLRLQVDPYMWKLLTEYPIHDSITLLGSISGQSRDDEEKLETRDSANDQAVDLKFRFSIP